MHLFLSEASTIAGQASLVEEHYLTILFGLGGMILLVAWLPILLKRLPLSLPIMCVAIGAILFSIEPFSTWAPHPEKTPTLVERATEFIYAENAGGFINSAMGFSPTMFVLPTYPEATLGAVGFEGGQAHQRPSVISANSASTPRNAAT